MEQQTAPKTAKVDKLSAKVGASQLALIVTHIVALAAAITTVATATADSITSLIDGGGMLALSPFKAAIVAAALVLVASITAKKITEKENLKKGYSIAAAAMTVVAAIAAVSAVAIIPFALFAIGAGGSIQKDLWLNNFVPTLISAVVAAATVIVFKKLRDGMPKLMQFVTYGVLGLAGVALILTIIGVFVGFYGKNKCEDVSNFSSTSQWLKECSDLDLGF
jgi:hypothetical protein